MWSTQVPIKLLSDDKITDGDRVVIIAILSHMRTQEGKLVCWPSNQRIADVAGKPVATVKRILWKLRIIEYVRDASEAEVHAHSIPERARGLVLELPYGVPCFISETPDVSFVKPEVSNKKNGSLPKVTPIDVDEIITHVNNVTGRTYRVGTHRSKPITKNVKARLDELIAEQGDLEKAKIQAKIVVDEKMIQSREGKFGEQFIRPSTLYRPGNFVEYLEEARERARKSGGLRWFQS